MTRPHRRPTFLAATCLLVAVAYGCAAPSPEPEPAPPAAEGYRGPNPLRDAYFGDVHVHTRYSFDAYIFGTRTTPDDAYRYAKGEPIRHAGGFGMRLREPLDFLAVTDHSEFLGVMSSMEDPAGPLSSTELGGQVRDADQEDEMRTLFRSLGPRYESGELMDVMAGSEPVIRDTWRETIEAANRHYAPGTFTTFIGYEYTSAPETQNLHRNVIFRGDAPPEPFSSTASRNPEDLWAWLDARRAEGLEALAIPHNSNGSNGQMFKLTNWAGAPLDAAYADLRMRNEPLVEITQVKGTSDTHPLLSPNDEWANFEIFPFRISTTIPSEPHGSYVREALLNGLEMEGRGGFNPFRFGVIGSSDTHNSAGSYDESDFHSKVGKLDDTPVERGSVPVGAGGEPGAPADVAKTTGAVASVTPETSYEKTYYDLWGASGLAGVWAEENTREAIYDALRRKETFATTGPRIRVRFFAGRDFPEGLADDPEAIAKAYAGGVPMGGDVVGGSDARAPRFLAWAVRDPSSAPLQRLQIVKGWLEGGAAREEIFDVACSDGQKPDAATHRCPDNGASVNLADCSISTGSGAAELRSLWSDPAFDPAQRALYYVRVLENPTCRWSTWDAIRSGVAPRATLPATIQERAWSSPIWYTPATAPGA